MFMNIYGANGSWTIQNHKPEQSYYTVKNNKIKGEKGP